MPVCGGKCSMELQHKCHCQGHRISLRARATAALEADCRVVSETWIPRSRMITLTVWSKRGSELSTATSSGQCHCTSLATI